MSSIRAVVGRAAKRVPPIARLRADRDAWTARAGAAQREADTERERCAGLAAQLAAQHVALADVTQQLEDAMGGADARQAFPPGHFYSPIPNLAEVREREESIFDRSRRTLPGLDPQADRQLAHLPRFAELYAEQPFQRGPQEGLRYCFDNGFFSYGDGLALYCMLRDFAPRQVVEVGSGWSSAIMLDVNDVFFDGATHLTFIEPYADRLHELMRPSDTERVTLIERPLHNAPDSVFAELAAGDMLFIDSTHVSRVGSDVNRLLLDVIPALPAGVLVHVHDVFWPFEYPKQWIYEGRAWNEDYLLRALLTSNDRLSITWFNNYLHCFHADEVAAAMPLWRENSGGSIYLTT